MTVSTVFMFGKLGCVATLPSVTAMFHPSVPCQVNYAMDAAQIDGIVVMEGASRFSPIMDMMLGSSPEAAWLWNLPRGESVIARTLHADYFMAKGAGLGALSRSVLQRCNGAGGESGSRRSNGRLLRYWDCVTRTSTRTNWRNLFA